MGLAPTIYIYPTFYLGYYPGNWSDFAGTLSKADQLAVVQSIKLSNHK